MNKKTFDEVFKNQIKRFLEKFAIVKTEYEILKLPKKVDILIIETKEPIHKHVALFTYFKKYNIIEFKSESDDFELEDLYKIGIYINGVLLKEKESNLQNTTFTLVTTNQPKWLLGKFGFEKVKKGLYKSKEISIVEIYVVLLGEIEFKFQQEIGILKLFTPKKDREIVIHNYLTNGNAEILEDIFLLYEEEAVKLLERMGKDMTAVQTRVMQLAKKYGVRERLLKEGESVGIEKGIEKGRLDGIEKVALQLLLKKAKPSFIQDVTGLSLIQIKELQKKTKVQSKKKAVKK